MTPEGWSTRPLEALAAPEARSFVDGDWIESKDQDPAGTIRLLQVGNILRGKLRTAGTLRWVNDETAVRLGCTLLKERDLLIARMPDPVGRACLVPQLPYRAITAVDCAILRVDETVSDPGFLVQFMNSDRHLAAVASHITGTTRQRVSRGNLGGLSILLPPLPEQRKIAAILSSVDDAIEATQAVIDQLQVVKKAMMAELLTRGLPGRHTRFKQTEIGEVPEEWEVVPVGELARIEMGETLIAKDLTGDGIPVFSAGRDPLPWGFTRLSRKRFGRGTIVLGARGTIGYPRLPDYDEFVSTQTTIAVTAGENVGAAFLKYALDTKNYSEITATQAVPMLTITALKPMLIAVPSRDEQRTIAASLHSIDLRIQQETDLLESQSELKSALLSVLLTGEVRVAPDPEGA